MPGIRAPALNSALGMFGFGLFARSKCLPLNVVAVFSFPVFSFPVCAAGCDRYELGLPVFAGCAVMFCCVWNFFFSIAWPLVFAFGVATGCVACTGVCPFFLGAGLVE